jgi:uncharacterized protein
MNALKVIVAPIKDEAPGVWRPFSEKPDIMPAGQAERVINDALSSGSSEISFVFCGPEPTLAGKDFFRMFLNIERELTRPGQGISNTVCTCGDYLDEEWTEFFIENGIEAQIVIDGHWDQVCAGGACPSWDHSWKTTEKAAVLLKEHGLKALGVCYVTSFASRRAQGIYGYLKKINFDRCRFIPCTEPERRKRACSPWALTPVQYERFQKTFLTLVRGLGSGRRNRYPSL